MPWIQVSVTSQKIHHNEIENYLFQSGAHTVTLEANSQQEILEPAPNETPLWEDITITGLFDFENSTQILVENIKACLCDIKFQIKTEILQDKNWTQAWMDNYHAMQFGQRLWICPLHITPPEPNAINLRLDPGLAFGTGTHPTTSLCLSWLDENIKQQKTLLDFGCGSGVLAIAACLLGCQQADALDIDPQAIIATKANAKINHIESQIHTYLTDEFKQNKAEQQYDIVVANILSGTLSAFVDQITHHTKVNGKIILSGILKEQAADVIKIYQPFFTMKKPRYLDEWVLLEGKRK